MYEEIILIGTDTTSGIYPQISDAILEASNTKTYKETFSSRSPLNKSDHSIYLYVGILRINRISLVSRSLS